MNLWAWQKNPVHTQVHLSLGKRHIGNLACHCRLLQTFYVGSRHQNCGKTCCILLHTPTNISSSCIIWKAWKQLILPIYGVFCQEKKVEIMHPSWKLTIAKDIQSYRLSIDFSTSFQSSVQGSQICVSLDP